MNDQLLTDAWIILVKTARAKRTITYKELSEALNGRVIPRAIGRVLTPIFEQFTLPSGLPDISAVAVRKDRGYPGDSWWESLKPRDLSIWRKELGKCWAYDWPDFPPKVSIPSSRRE